MLQSLLQNYKVILASGSPRRQQLLKELGLTFEVSPLDIKESYPPHLKGSDIAIYLSELKARAFDFQNQSKECLVITADTIVWLDGQVLPKPKDEQEAFSILQKLSGKSHEVITGVSLRTNLNIRSFFSVTKVWFKNLSPREIQYYVTHFHPFDKAGAYGIQEWIGYIGIEKIEGSYFNVVGLPVQRLYTELIRFVQ